MITKQQFSAAVLYFKGLSGITSAPTPEYLQACYGELANTYTAGELETAARDIAATEDTYGQYPSLRLWLKHCPAHKRAATVIQEQKSKFLDCLAAYIDADVWLLPDMEQSVIDAGGERGKLALQNLGYSLQVIRGLAKSMPGIIAQVAKSWDNVAMTPAAIRLEMQEMKKIEK